MTSAGTRGASGADCLVKADMPNNVRGLSFDPALLREAGGGGGKA